MSTLPDHESGPTLSDFEVALRMREFEIVQLTNRNNFFMIFQGVLLAAVVQSGHTAPVVTFLASMAGLLVSLLQTGMACGAKFWQEYWEEILATSEELAKSPEPATLFHRSDPTYFFVVQGRFHRRTDRRSGGWLRRLVSSLVLRRFSVSAMPIYVGAVFAAIWGFLLLCTVDLGLPFAIPEFIVGAPQSRAPH